MVKKYIINPSYTLILKKDNVLLCINKQSKIIKIGIGTNSNELESINTILNNATFPKSNSDIFSKLLKKKIIMLCNYESSDYNSKIYIDSFLNRQSRVDDLKNKRVMIIGLGGIGCEIINHLIGIGVSNFVLVDYDKIERSNLNRQYLFTQNDLVKNKTDIVEKKILSRIPTAEVMKNNIQIENSAQILDIMDKSKQIDMIICAADNPFLNIRMAVLQAAIKTNCPCIFGGVGVFKGEYGPLFFNNNKKRKYYDYLEKYQSLIRNYSLNKASFGPTNSIISAYMAKDVIFSMLNAKKKVISLNCIVEIDFENGEINEKKQF